MGTLFTHVGVRDTFCHQKELQLNHNDIIPIEGNWLRLCNSYVT